MIRVKSAQRAAIPLSLVVRTEDTTSSPSMTTHQRRLELIEAGAYIDEKVYNDRYKQKDTKATLNAVFHGKCCYCESRPELRAVEHYRPKAEYYWLAYSWDNLLLTCFICNSTKGNRFKIWGEKRAYKDEDLAVINAQLAVYQAVELPKLLHPELDNAEPVLTFLADGCVSSEDERANYTIETCGLDRNSLRDARRRVLDRFREDLESALTVADRAGVDEPTVIRIEVAKFKKCAFQDPENDFLAFRRYVAKHLLMAVIDEVLDRYHANPG